MMNQELTFKNSIVSYFLGNLPSLKINNAQKCLEYLLQNYFVVDDERNKVRKFLLAMDSAGFDNNNTFHIELMELLQKQFENKFKSVKCNYYSESDDIDLSRFSSDKILLDFGISNEELNKIKLSKKVLEYDIEVHNENTFINPPHNCRIKNIPTEIVCDDNEIYELENIFYPFLRTANEITFEDPYILNRNGFINLKKILGKCVHLNSNVKICLKLFPKEVSGKSVNSDYLDELKKKYNVDLKYYTPSENKLGEKRSYHVDRFLFTEHYEIYIAGGLDQFRYGKVNSESRAKIRINFRD